MAVAKEAI
jgi:hypothetical protein